MAKIKEKIRQTISQGLDVLIPENKWDQYIELLDRDGKFTRKNMLMMIMVACKHIETLENILEDHAFQIELLQGNNPSTTAISNKSAEIKLKTATDIFAFLDKNKTEDTKVFYVSPEDWKVLEKAVDPSLAKTNHEYGFGKENDPKDGREKTCLYHNDLPVFKR